MCVLPFVSLFLFSRLRGRIRASSVSSCVCFLPFVSPFLLSGVRGRIRASSASSCISFVCRHVFLCFCSSGCVGGFARKLFRRAFVVLASVFPVEQDARGDSRVLCFVVQFICLLILVSVFLLSRMRERIRARHPFCRAFVLLPFVSSFLLSRMCRRIRASSVSSCVCFVCCHLFLCFC